MKNQIFIQNFPIFVGKNEKGRAIFANKRFKVGDVIEVAPILKFKYIPENQLYEDEYSFEWNDEYWCIALGYGSLYNHSYNANAKFVRDFSNETISFIAVKQISALEEITINYGGHNSTDKVWFDTK